MDRHDRRASTQADSIRKEGILKSIRSEVRMASTKSGLSGAGGLVLLGFLVAPQTNGQPAALAFEVVSVIATSGLNGVRGGCRGIDSVIRPQTQAPPPLGRCVFTDARLSHLIGIAFGVSMQALKTSPD
jgi:hypothetical protein